VFLDIATNSLYLVQEVDTYFVYPYRIIYTIFNNLRRILFTTYRAILIIPSEHIIVWLVDVKYVKSSQTGHWNVLSRVRCTGHGNDFELIPTVWMESQHSIGAPTCHDFPRFVIILEKSQPEVGNH